MSSAAALSPADITHAEKILRENDLGGYTVPCQKLYPFQWNWDSVITALGWQRIDEARAWQELRSLLTGQWQNGMIPHIIFHQPSADYFPGPEVWGVAHTPPTSAISQPPILASGCRQLFENAHNKTAAKKMLTEFFPPLCAYHLWWINERSGTKGNAPDGLIRSYHPWESGRDNSPVWDEPLAAVAPVAENYQRKDTALVAAQQRPHRHQYNRYIALVHHFKQHQFNAEVLQQNCPYQVLDIGIIALFYQATDDLQHIARAIGATVPADITDFQKSTAAHINFLWDTQNKMFYSYDLLTQQPLRKTASDSFLTLYAKLADRQQAAHLHTVIRRWLAAAAHGLPSYAPDDAAFEPQRYWCGPVWLHINRMVAQGLHHYGHTATARAIRRSSAALIARSGFAEYYNPITAEACGGKNFSWTAATALHWLTAPTA